MVPVVNLIAMRGFLQVTDTLVERGEELIEAAKADPVLAGVLIGVGVLTALIFVVGLGKQAFKAALVGAILSAGTWYWYFNIR